MNYLRLPTFKLIGRITLFFTLISLNNILLAENQTHNLKEEVNTNALNLEIYNTWIETTLMLNQQTPGYTPPVAARTMAYLAKAVYVTSLNDSIYLEMSNKLDLSGIKQPNFEGRISHLPILVNELCFNMIKYYYINMPPRNLKKVEQIYENLSMTIKPNFKKKEIKEWRMKGENLAQQFIKNGMKDGGAGCWNTNFPKVEINYCDSCWIPTYPGYVSAMQPYWGQLRTILPSNKTLCDTMRCIPFGTKPGSQLYEENNDIVLLYDTINQTQKNIAEHWDDSPGVSGTPVGHLFSIALQISKKEKYDFKRTTELYLALGIAVNDAVIECWRLKYHFNFIRPITYIQKYITEDFQPILITPPFPEFPSGHSFQAGSALEVFIHFFGNDYPIEDNTNVGRTDIHGMQHKYDSFTEMCFEMSLSRYYGGIHYLKTLNLSRDFGRKFGKNTINELFETP